MSWLNRVFESQFDRFCKSQLCFNIENEENNIVTGCEQKQKSDVYILNIDPINQMVTSRCNKMFTIEKKKMKEYDDWCKNQ